MNVIYLFLVSVTPLSNEIHKSLAGKKEKKKAFAWFISEVVSQK